MDTDGRSDTWGIGTGAPPGGADALSPLGALYRREALRLARRWPDLGPDRRAWLILVALARVFLDVEAEDLARAMAEGEPNQVTARKPPTSESRALATRALDVARRERDHGPG